MWNLGVSEIIQIISIICSSLLSAISVIIAIATLLQANKTLQETTRPYITISYEVINTTTPNTFFLIKNYGQTSAKIIDFQNDLQTENPDIEYQFSKIIGTNFAPGQRKIYWFDASSVPKDEISFTITYQCGKKIYHEHVPLKIKNGAISLRTKDERAISYSLQEIAERLL